MPRTPGNGDLVQALGMSWGHAESDEGALPRTSAAMHEAPRCRLVGKQTVHVVPLGQSSTGQRPPGQDVERRRRPRRPPARTRTHCHDLVSFNSTGKPQLEALLDSCAEASTGSDAPPQSSLPRLLAVMSQEHRMQEVSWDVFRERAHRRGWSSLGSPATSGPGGGCSAGTAVFALTARPRIGPLPVLGFDLSPPSSLGRLTCCWAELGAGKGLLLLSIYLWTGEGPWSVKNIELLEAAGSAIRQHGGPWVLCGDFNCDPACLTQSEWPARIGGFVVAPSEATCNSGNTLDFFVVDIRISACVVKVFAEDGWAMKQHRPVRLRLDLDISPVHIIAQRIPRPFPRSRPVGPAREPAVLPGGLAEALADASDASALGLIWYDLAAAAETDLCGLCDLVDGAGNALSSHCGRGLGLVLRKRTSRIPSTGMFGSTSKRARGLAYLLDFVKRVAVLLEKIRSDGESPGRLAHLAALHSQLRSPCKVVQELEGFEAKWRDLLCELANSLWVTDNGIEMAHALIVRIDTAANSEFAERRSSRNRSFWEWVNKSLRTGAGALHRLTKSADLDLPSPVAVASGLSLSPQASVDAEREAWAAIWLRHPNAASPWRGAAGLSSLGEHTMPPISGHDILRAALSFPERKGYVGFHPRWFAWVSDGVRSAIARLLMACEAVGMWPGQISYIIMHLIPKRGGGRRPIGITESLCRLWERARKPIIAQWRSATDRPFDWSACGRQIADAVWVQALHDEVGRASGQCSSTVLLDLVKAFESLRLDAIWQAGIEHGYPLHILRMSMELFAFVRHLSCQGAVASSVHTLSAVLAGSTFATDALFLAFLSPCDRLQRYFPAANLALVVDDLSVQMVGSMEAVSKDTIDATEFLIEDLETSLGCLVSRGEQWAPSGKTVFAASHRLLRHALARRFKRLGIATVTSARNLGIDYDPSGGRRRPVQAQRLRALRIRTTRLLKSGVRGKAGMRVARAGLMPSVTYGTACIAVSNTFLKQISSTVHRAFGPSKGRSAYARLRLTGGLPGALPATAPIVAWSRAFWDQLVPFDLLERSWRIAIVEVGVAGGRPSGPAGAAVFAAKRVGWAFPHYAVFKEAHGHLLDCRVEAPKTIERAAADAFELASAGQSRLAARICEIPDLEALSNFHKSSRWSPAVRGSLRALAEGGWWSRERLFEAGLVDSAACTACGEPISNLRHWSCYCPRSLALAETASDDVQAAVATAAAHRESDPLLDHGIPARVPLALPPPAEVRALDPDGKEIPLESVRFAGEAFSDGSLISPLPHGARRAGWAAIGLSSDGVVRHRIFGTCPDRFPSAYRAELRGVLAVLQRAIAAVSVTLDCLSVVEAFARGRSACCSSRKRAADLWREVWREVGRLGGPGAVQLNWCKGHATDSDVESGRTTERLRSLNDAVDKLAGLGSELARELVPNVAERKAYLRAKRWYEWLALLIADWQKHHGGVRRTLPQDSALSRKRRQWKRHDTRPHDLWRRHSVLCCALCGRSTQCVSRWRAFCRSPCRATVTPQFGGQSSASQAISEAMRRRGDDSRVGLRQQGFVILADGPPEECTAQVATPVPSEAAGPSARLGGPSPELVTALAHVHSKFGHDWRTRFHASHRLTLTLPFVHCRVCGRRSEDLRVLRALTQPCAGAPPPGSSFRGQAARLADGKHPVTGRPLDTRRPCPLPPGFMQ